MTKAALFFVLIYAIFGRPEIAFIFALLHILFTVWAQLIFNKGIFSSN